MHEWSPVHTSGSTPNRGCTTVRPSDSRVRVSGRIRRWRSSWHSPRAITTFSPFTRVVRASRSVPIIFAMSYESTVRIHETPTPRSACGIVIPVGSLRAFVPVEGLWCWPVAEV